MLGIYRNAQREGDLLGDKDYNLLIQRHCRLQTRLG